MSEIKNYETGKLYKAKEITNYTSDKHEKICVYERRIDGEIIEKIHRESYIFVLEDRDDETKILTSNGRVGWIDK